MNVKLLRAEWCAVRRATLRLMQHSLSMVGLASVAVVGVIAAHPEYAHAVGHWIVPGVAATARPATIASTPSTSTVSAQTPDPLGGSIAHPVSEAGRMLGLAMPSVEGKAPVAVTRVSADRASSRESSREMRDVTNYLSKKYRINSGAIAMLVDAAYVTGRDLGVDPLLLLSVMGIESGFNPFAESTAGASGLMQLMSKVHRDKLNDFGGPNIALNPIVNLRVGAVVLKDCIRRGGSIADGLRLYVGAGTGDDSGYGARVLQEKDRLSQAARGLVVQPRIEPIPARAEKVAPPAAEPVAPQDDKAEHKLDTATDPDNGRVASL